MDASMDAPNPSISKAKLYETFDVLPNLIDVLKEVLSTSSTQETIRIGDVSASAVAVKQKYIEAMELLRSLPGTNTSLEEQETAIADAKVELKRLSYVLKSHKWSVVELYSNTLYRGTDEPRAEINDAFSRKSLLK